jgi:tRNA(fMet)-specific endonuclease VapC
MAPNLFGSKSRLGDWCASGYWWWWKTPNLSQQQCRTSTINWLIWRDGCNGRAMHFKPSGCSVTPGKRYLLDTNALVALLQGHEELLALTVQAQWLGVSVINVLEFLGFDGLTDADRDLFAVFLSRIAVVDLAYENSALMALIADIRKRKAVKLPDAIVAASAVLNQAILVTNDAQLLKLAAEDASYAALPFWP